MPSRGFLLSPHAVIEEPTTEELIIAALAFGATLGFGWLTTWTAIRQTVRIWKRYGSQSVHNTYVWLIWLEILVCYIFGITCWLYLRGNIPTGLPVFMVTLTTWALQVHFLLQIIINRCSLLIHDRRTIWRLKVWIAVIIVAINISVYNIRLPARLQISERYIWINKWWDRCEKVIYLLIDGALNVFFIITVKKNLVSNGLTKYNKLVNFNSLIVCLSLSMDILIIGMMSLPNSFVYMQFHPLAYMVKLNIELSMADLIAKVARQQQRLPTWQSIHSQPLALALHSFSQSYTAGGGGGGGGGDSGGGVREVRITPLPLTRRAILRRAWERRFPIDLDCTLGSASSLHSPTNTRAPPGTPAVAAAAANTRPARPTLFPVTSAGVELSTVRADDFSMIKEPAVAYDDVVETPSSSVARTPVSFGSLAGSRPPSPPLPSSNQEEHILPVSSQMRPAPPDANGRPAQDEGDATDPAILSIK